MQPFSQILNQFVPLLTDGTIVHVHGTDPADFTRFVPQGLGLGTPLMLGPSDGLADLVRRGDYYGFDVRSGDPIRDAPSVEPSGGVVYFDDSISPSDLDTLMCVLGVRARETVYLVLCASAENPLQARYLDQIRLFPPSALKDVFGFRPGPKREWLGEGLTIAELFHLFLKLQRERWSTPGYAFSPKLARTFGGDEDWAKESLAFGLLVENTSWGIYRLWSRAWLVTK